MRKVAVGVLAQFGADGSTHPISVTWEDGRIYPIESVLEMKNARTQPGRFRYTIRVHGQSTYLYRTGDRWHMESME